MLLSDTEAEHIPGCNMAFRRDALLAIGGFDPQFRVAGDDVDVCWRLQEQGLTLGFHAAARGLASPAQLASARYWRQQQGYGKAEALLERKWPERYNRRGHVDLGGPPLRPRQRQPVAAGAHLPRHVGHRRYSSRRSPRATSVARRAGADPGVVSGMAC